MFEPATKESGIEYVAKSNIEINDPAAIKAIESLFDALDQHPDVKEIYSNAKFP